MKTLKVFIKVLAMAGASALLAAMAGCVAYSTTSGIKPIYPKTGLLIQTVDSLQPEFQWRGLGTGKTYDLAVWDSIKVGEDPVPKRRRMIYERSGIAANLHKLEIQLEPGNFYYWSVRETGTSTWATTSLHAHAVSTSVAASVRDTDMFHFWTPKLEKLAEQ
jgi:hypothetical protein